MTTNDAARAGGRQGAGLLRRDWPEAVSGSFSPIRSDPHRLWRFDPKRFVTTISERLSGAGPSGCPLRPLRLLPSPLRPLRQGCCGSLMLLPVRVMWLRSRLQRRCQRALR